MIEPFINFMGRANEAVEFYETVFECGEKEILRYSDMPANPDFPVSDEMKNWVGFGKMTICGSRVNFSDTQPDAGQDGMISLILRFESPEKLLDIYGKLLEGGTALMEAEPQFFAKMYGWVKDRFGVDWQLICE